MYTQAAMGMPGSTECLDQLMFRVLGDLIHEGVVMKIADDLYVGGNDIASLLYLDACSQAISAHKPSPITIQNCDMSHNNHSSRLDLVLWIH